ncbi:hypothetical protein CKM354_000789900 [Cercospora kikuchii]|uniref:Uncharacterized protein n=1 Tax=Cercospora kikuchii TaxID=84275 RepID=A0A9P3CL16_9PEZI|nr:uncharacterized protein CKM354_000789900 [Cercospora kikuchii]GIZ44708.1 hypothetical protein CKM354_000789900 [Cercospora kikuchii]
MPGGRREEAIERTNTAERKAESAVEQARTVEGHIQAIFQKLQASNLLLLLPRAPMQFMLKDIPDRAQVFAKQVRSYEQERGNSIWANNRRKCLGNLVILSQFTPDGVSPAVTQATIWASRELRSHYDSSPVKRLVELDHILLAELCTM